MPGLFVCMGILAVHNPLLRPQSAADQLTAAGAAGSKLSARAMDHMRR